MTDRERLVEIIDKYTAEVAPLGWDDWQVRGLVDAILAIIAEKDKRIAELESQIKDLIIAGYGLGKDGA